MGVFSKLFKRAPRIVTAEIPAKSIRGGYDAASGGNETKNLWTLASSLDADACNSLAVRRKLRNYSREERNNNGHCAGIISTHTNYIVGTGPKLRVLTQSTGFNQMVETKWEQWCKATRFTAKLRTMCMAKICDGEAFAILADNPNSTDLVSLDLRLLECDQITAPVMKTDDEQYVDGIRFDGFGNPASYDVLRQHPGSSWYSSAISTEYDTVPAASMLHWFSDTRPGQHRGIPELASSLSLFGTSRRYREAVVAAAETAADVSAVMEMGMANEGNDEAAPFTSLPIEKRMMVVSPAGAKMSQLKAEQPTTTYDMFVRNMICEEARPLNMPYNIAACDSSGYSFSGGQLDHQTYFVSVGVERQDCVLEVLDHAFATWFEQAKWAHGWSVPASPAPRHGWGWNKKPQNDPVKTANARKISLSCGAALLSDIYAEDGEDYVDKVARMAIDYGVTVDEIKAKLFEAVFQKSGGAPAPSKDAGKKSDEPTKAPNGNGDLPTKAGGNGRLTFHDATKVYQ